MTLSTWYWRASATLAGTGTGVTVLTFNSESPWLFVGLTMTLMAATTANTGYIAQRSRTLDEEFDAGYRVGYRAGRRAPAIAPVSPIRPPAGGLHEFNRGVKNGRLSKAPIGSVPSHGQAPRRA